MEIYANINTHAQTCTYTCVSRYDDFIDIIYIKTACRILSGKAQKE